ASLRLHLAQRPPSPLLPYTTLFRSDRSPIEHYDIGVWQRVMHINVNTVFILTRFLLPLLKQSTDASILFTTSGVGRRGRAFWGRSEEHTSELQSRENLVCRLLLDKH